MGRLVPVVRPKQWQAASVNRSRERTDRIARTRKQTEGMASDDAVDECSKSPGHCRVGSDRHRSGRLSSDGWTRWIRARPL